MELLNECSDIMPTFTKAKLEILIRISKNIWSAWIRVDAVKRKMFMRTSLRKKPNEFWSVVNKKKVICLRKMVLIKSLKFTTRNLYAYVFPSHDVWLAIFRLNIFTLLLTNGNAKRKIFGSSILY